MVEDCEKVLGLVAKIRSRSRKRENVGESGCGV
jgi:hypothetical protein